MTDVSRWQLRCALAQRWPDQAAVQGQPATRYPLPATRYPLPVREWGLGWAGLGWACTCSWLSAVSQSSIRFPSMGIAQPSTAADDRREKTSNNYSPAPGYLSSPHRPTSSPRGPWSSLRPCPAVPRRAPPCPAVPATPDDRPYRRETPVFSNQRPHGGEENDKRGGGGGGLDR